MRNGSLMALCLIVVACAGPNQARETTRASARSRAPEWAYASGDEEAGELIVARPRRGPAIRTKSASEADPLVQVSRRLDDRKASAQENAGALGQPRSLAQHDERGEQASGKVGVQGIHGTLSPYDVKLAMDKRNKEFAGCLKPRARKVPELAGGVGFEIRVLGSGQVADVLVRQSDLGDRVLERCFSDVIRGTRFPAPHGGEATVQWQMALASESSHPEPEAWDSERIERVLRKNRGDLLETCDVKRGGGITVTAYVSRHGKVLAAGVAAPDGRSAEQFDCIAEELRSWPMPKPRKGIAKVTFALRS